MERRDSLRAYELTKGRIGLICALSHVVDLEGFIRLMERIASAEGAVAGFGPEWINGAADWAESARAILVLRDSPIASGIEPDVKTLMEERISEWLREEEVS